MHPRRTPLALSALLLIWIPAVAAPQAAAARNETTAATAFVEWARETAIPIDLSAGLAPAILEPHVKGKRFVFLGEPDHYIHEKYAFRLSFLKALHALGWRHLGMEMGRSDGIRFDRYLADGREKELHGIGLYAGAGGKTSPNGFLAMEFVYARALRAMAPDAQRLHYFGFDLDMTPGNGMQDACARMAGLQGGDDLRFMLEDVWSTRKRGEELAALIVELEDPESTFLEDFPAELALELLLDLKNLSESLHFSAQNIFAVSEPANLAEAFARREQMMFELFDGYVASHGPEERIVLTGHNMHLSRDWRGAWWRELETEFPIQLWPTIGAHVRTRFPDDVFAIWLVYDHGSHLNAPNLTEVRELASVPGTVESLLAQLPHDALFLPLASADTRSAWLDEERSFRVNGGVGHGHLRRLADALVFVREVEPPHTGD